MRVRVLKASSAYSLQEKVNEWLEEKDGSISIVNIQYSVSMADYGHKMMFVHGAMIQYN